MTTQQKTWLAAGLVLASSVGTVATIRGFGQPIGARIIVAGDWLVRAGGGQALATEDEVHASVARAFEGNWRRVLADEIAQIAARPVVVRR